VQSSFVFWEGTDAICRQSDRVCALSYVFTVFKKIEKTAACEMRSVTVHDDPRSGRPSVVDEDLVREWKRRFKRTDDSSLSLHFP
jgi:hypothetical protein